MCFSLHAEPPVPPVSGGAVRGEELVLTSMDGTRFAAFAGHVDTVTPPAAGIVILPDVRGLFRFYRDLALRFASAGVEAVAIDYFGRTAGLTPRDENFEYWPHVEKTTTETITQDVAAAVAYLHSQAGRGPRAIFTVGFCFGGGHSFYQAAAIAGLAGVIGFYGQPRANVTYRPSPVEHAREFKAPVLGLFGGADPSIPAAATQEFDAALATAGVPHEIVVYPGAPHSFFDRTQGQYQAESTDAWKRVLGFIQRYTPAA